MNVEIFQGLLLTPGDKISFKLKGFDISNTIETAVIEISEDGKALHVIVSAMLKRFKPSGILEEDEVEELKVVEKATEAVWRGTRKQLHKDQKVHIIAEGKTHIGVMVAAYDGIGVCKKGNGQYVTGGAYYFKPF